MSEKGLEFKNKSFRYNKKSFVPLFSPLPRVFHSRYCMLLILVAVLIVLFAYCVSALAANQYCIINFVSFSVVSFNQFGHYGAFIYSKVT